MTHHEDPYQDQHALPPIPESAGGSPPASPAEPSTNVEIPPPSQPQPWPSPDLELAREFPRAAFPPAVPAQADPRQWDRVEPPRPAPAQFRRPPVPQPASARYPAQPGYPAPAGYFPSAPQYQPPAAGDATQGIDETAWSTAAAERTGPKQGWRAKMAKVGIKLSKSARELDYDRDVLRMQRKLAYPQNVIFINLKGGVGKSTIAITLGSTLAAHRHVSDVVAFDSATDGSLRRRMPVDQNRAVTSDASLFLRSLKARAQTGDPNARALSGSEVQVQLYSNSAGLQALVAAQHLQDYQLEAAEFGQILGALHNEYMVNFIDMGPDRRVPTFWPALRSAHAVVLVTTPNSISIDNAKRFIELLRDSEFKNLLTRTVLVWNNAAPGKEVVINVDATKNVLVRQLSPQNDPSTCLVDIPLDPHLAAGGEINLALLRNDTRRQFERAAALLMDKLPDRRLPDRTAAQH